MSNPIKFSILIPVYNVKKYLKQCIESVLNQTYRNLEIILIDDGSTDTSGEICDRYKKEDKRVKVYHQQNQGLVMARRNAIEKASGDFYLFLDSDDYWDSDLLETIEQTIIKYDADLIIFKYKRVSESGEYKSEQLSQFNNKTLLNKEELLTKMINSSNLNNLVCKAAKSTIIDGADYKQYKTIRNAEDLLQSLPLIYSANRIIYLDKPLYNYRTVERSITQTINPNFISDISTVRGVFLKYMKKMKIDSNDNMTLFYDFYISSVINYVYKLANSSFTKKKKNEIYEHIISNHLYIEALTCIDTSHYSLMKKITLYLLNKKYYGVLLLYVDILDYLKRFVKQTPIVLGRSRRNA